MRVRKRMVRRLEGGPKAGISRYLRLGPGLVRTNASCSTEVKTDFVREHGLYHRLKWPARGKDTADCRETGGLFRLPDEHAGGELEVPDNVRRKRGGLV